MKIIREGDGTLKKILPPAGLSAEAVYIPSQYALPFAHRGRNYIFHTLTRQCVEGKLPAHAKAGEGSDDLIRARFLVPEGSDECGLYSKISALLRAYSQKEGVRGYTILPTFACNARCVYCYEAGTVPVSMTPETADRVVRFILDTRGEGPVKISWFGGEPLLGVSVIDRICRGLREAGVEYRSSMTSNGSLITPEIVEKMRGEWKLSRIQISMDGAEADYISRKRYCGGQDPYRAVMEAVSRMSGAGIKVTVRCNVDPENWERIPAFLKDLGTFVENKEKVSLYFAPLNHVRRSETSLPLWEKIRDARRLIDEAGFRSMPFPTGGLGRRTNFCMADGGGLVITPDGGLYPCEQCPGGSRFGDIRQGVCDEEARREFCRTDRIREECRTCPFLPDCTGFSSCPVKDAHCRKVREMMITDELRRLADRKETENTEREGAFC